MVTFAESRAAIPTTDATGDRLPPSAWNIALGVLGADRAGGSLLYWDQQGVFDAVKSIKAALGELVGCTGAAGDDIDRWLRSASDADIDGLMHRAESEITVPVVDLTTRPWASTNPITRSRIPYVPLAAATHALIGELAGTVADLFALLGSDGFTDPWTFLSRIDDKIRPLEVDIDRVEAIASGLRLALNAQDDIVSPTRWLYERGVYALPSLEEVAEAAIIEAGEVPEIAG